MTKQTFNDFVINEGGAGSHMWHPFDIPSVNSGRDLIKVFQQVVDSIREVGPKVKTDGVNTSCKVITNEYGEKEFALDRGSMKELDVSGVTKDKLRLRFPPGHAIIDLAENVLDILNRSLPSIQEELIKLDLWDNPNKCINMDTIFGKTNVIDYGDDMIVFHNILEFVQATPRRRSTIFAKYTESDLENLARKVNIKGQEKGVTIMTDPVARFINDSPVNMQYELMNENFTIVYDETTSVTRPLYDWLVESTNPGKLTIKTRDGKKVGALSKFVYTTVLNRTPLREVFKSEDLEYAIYGAAFYHATRFCGKVILSNLTSDVGDLIKHEGIVINDPSIAPNIFKITGDFIIGGMQSDFQKK